MLYCIVGVKDDNTHTHDLRGCENSRTSTAADDAQQTEDCVGVGRSSFGVARYKMYDLRRVIYMEVHWNRAGIDASDVPVSGRTVGTGVEMNAVEAQKSIRLTLSNGRSPRLNTSER